MLRKNKKLISLIFIAIITFSLMTSLGNITYAQQPPQAETVKLSCVSLWDGISIEACFREVFAIFGTYWLQATGLILGLSGVVLNFIMNETVISMSKNLSSLLSSGGGIFVAWTAFRDLANIFFIFIILYIAIGTILRLDSINTKKLLVHIIIIALLLNFSLFFTKVIIDASNIVAISFYNPIAAGGGAAGVSNAIMQPLGLQSVWDPNGANTLLNKAGAHHLLNVFFVTVFGSILFIITAFILFATSLVLISRYIILIFLMIISPLAFLAMALPKDSYSKKWWDTLFKQCLFAPVFMAMLWASLLLLNSIMSPFTGGTFSDLATSMLEKNATGPNKSGLGLLMNFMLTIGLVIFSLIASNQIAGGGAKRMTAWGKKFANRLGGRMVTGTVGRISAAADRRLSQSSFGQTPLGTIVRAPLGGLSGLRVGGAKSGKQSQAEASKRNKEWARLQAEKKRKVAEKKAEEEASTRYAPIREARTTEFQEKEREEREFETESKKTARNNYDVEVQNIKTNEEREIKQVKQNIASAGFNLFKRKKLKGQLKQIRAEAKNKIKVEDDKLAEQEFTAEEYAKEKIAENKKPLEAVITAENKFKGDVFEAEKNKILAEIGKMRSSGIFTSRASNEQRKEFADLFRKTQMGEKLKTKKSIEDYIKDALDDASSTQEPKN